MLHVSDRLYLLYPLDRTSSAIQEGARPASESVLLILAKVIIVNTIG